MGEVPDAASPQDADPGKVSAEFKDGVLAVHLVKGEQGSPQQAEAEVEVF